MKVEGLEIIYPTHKVVCQPQDHWNPGFTDWYVQSMADELSPSGSIRDHARELRMMNNDGSWGIKKLEQDLTEPATLVKV